MTYIIQPFEEYRDGRGLIFSSVDHKRVLGFVVIRNTHYIVTDTGIHTMDTSAIRGYVRKTKSF